MQLSPIAEPEPLADDEVDEGDDLEPSQSQIQIQGQIIDRVETGRRFAHARELNGLNQIEAAKKLGYANSAPLCKVESGCSPASRLMIRRAAQAYGVSADFLLGLSDYPERDPRTVEQIAIYRGIKDAIERSARSIAEQSIVNAAETVPLKLRLAELIEAVKKVVDTLNEVRNKTDFDESVAGGARLVRTVSTLASAARAASKYLHRQNEIEKIWGESIATETTPAFPATASAP